MIYIDMLKHWVRMAGGSSYWHQQQGMGRAFRPGLLAGYFNDLTAKAAWPGEVDNNGIPLSVIAGKRVHWPTTVLQKGLAHWDLWLLSGCTSQKDRGGFLAAAAWAMETQDDRGGWPHPMPLHPHALSEYSCMSQGQGASLLARVHSVAQGERYVEAARRGLEIMLTPIEDGGTAIFERDGVVLEEYPSVERNTVLNGWVFAIFGLHDYALANARSGFEGQFASTLGKLMQYLPRFDADYWSLYDIKGAIASPFYHDLHIAQLEALCRTIPQHEAEVRRFKEKLERQRMSRLNTCRAMAAKARQKLLHPPAVVQQANILAKVLSQ